MVQFPWRQPEVVFYLRDVGGARVCTISVLYYEGVQVRIIITKVSAPTAPRASQRAWWRAPAASRALRPGDVSAVSCLLVEPLSRNLGFLAPSQFADVKIR